MPAAVPVITAALAAAQAYSAGGIILFGYTLVAGAVEGAIVAGLTALAFSAITGGFGGGAKGGSADPVTLNQDARERTRVIRSSTSPRRVIYGEALVSGTLVYADSTGSSKEFIHLVIVLTGHECQSLGTVFFTDEAETESRFSGYYRVNKHLGTSDQAADTDLVAESANWTNDHTLRGIAYIYARLKHSPDVWTSGIPNFKVLARGKKVYDPRDGVTRWTRNPALCIRDFVLDQQLGVGADIDEINEASFIAAANICDEFVAITGVTGTAGSVSTTEDTITLSDTLHRFERGTRVRITSTGSNPGGLTAGVDFYTVPSADRTTIKFATSYANALAETVVDITSAGSGTITITGTAQPRYTMDGTFEASNQPMDIAEAMMTCCAGILTYQEGQYFFYAGAARTVSDYIDATWLRGDMSIRPRISRRELYNAVRGTFVDPSQKWQPTDFPIVKNATYKAQDNNREIQLDTEMSYTIDVVRAQRLAKIQLERSRQGITIDMPCNAKALKVSVWSTVVLTFPQFGWASKQFRVISRRIIDNVGVDLTLQEDANSVYDWNSGDATVNDPAPDTTLALPWSVEAPGAPMVTEEIYETGGGSGTKSRAIITWEAPADTFISTYELEYKVYTDTEWYRFPAQTGEALTLNDLAPTIYDFRVRAINGLGVRSEYSPTTRKEVLGLYNPPSTLTGLTLTAGASSAFLRWDLSADLDVRIGGRILIRWSPSTTSAAWETSIDLFPSSGGSGGVAGNATEAAVPLVGGTYLLKAMDNTGNIAATAATVVSTIPDLIPMNVALTITESPSFAGSKTNLFVDSSGMKLVGSTSMDSWGTVDSLSTWDYIGGVVSSGTYLFATAADLGATYPVRIKHNAAVGAFLAQDLMDTRAGNVDDWDSFDGAVAGVEANVRIEYRSTTDNPSGSPTWGPWTPFVCANVSARAFQFRAVFESTDVAYNINLSALAVTIDMPDRVGSGSTASSSSADTTVTFPQQFYASPVVGYTIQGMQSGDYFELVSKSTTGFVFNIRNAGARVVRTVDWMAKGYGQGS